MKTFIFIMPCLFILHIGFSQTTDYADFINSFREEKTRDVVEFSKIAYNGTPVSKEEALKYIYSNDTSKLYCIQKSINFETETVSDIERVVFLPDKCIRVVYEHYIIIAYTTFECKNDITSLILTIFDKSNQLKNQITVYRGNNYDSSLDGLINLKNGVIFLFGKINDASKRQAIIYKINSINLNFEIIAENDNVSGSIYDLFRTLENLGWTEKFMN